MNKPKYIKDTNDGWCGKLNDEENCFFDEIINNWGNEIDITVNETLACAEYEFSAFVNKYIEITKEEYLNYIKENSLKFVLEKEEEINNKYKKDIKSISNLKTFIDEYK